MTNATTTTTPPSQLYIRPNPHHNGSVEILHLTLHPDTVWAVHFYGDTTQAPPDLFSDNPRLEALGEADQMREGDFDVPKEGLDGFHDLVTGSGDMFYGSGWTLMPAVPEH